MAPKHSPAQKASMSGAREASPVNKVNYEKLYDESQKELETALLENSALEATLLESHGLCESLKVSLAKAHIRENPNSTFPLITEIFGEITLNFRGLSQITALSKLPQITQS